MYIYYHCGTSYDGKATADFIWKIYGLPGFICSLEFSRSQEIEHPPLEIYGPAGLRKMLETFMHGSVQTMPKLNVHEIIEHDKYHLVRPLN
jgi:ribonuclease BN (tRNA processing enzyme)